MFPMHANASPLVANSHRPEPTQAFDAAALDTPRADAATRNEAARALRDGGFLTPSDRHIALSIIKTFRTWPESLPIHLVNEKGRLAAALGGAGLSQANAVPAVRAPRRQ